MLFLCKKVIAIITNAGYINYSLKLFFYQLGEA